MKILAATLCFVAIICGCAKPGQSEVSDGPISAPIAKPAGQWKTYKNDKYQYQVQYPDFCEVRITGPENARDGRTILIAVKNMTRMHGVDIEIFPESSLEQVMSKMKAPPLNELNHGAVSIPTRFHKITWQKVAIKDTAAVRMEARFNENDQLFRTMFVMDHVAFSASLLPDAGLDDQLAERIISSFKRETGTHNKPNAGDSK
jgi:hypothetical protein